MRRPYAVSQMTNPLLRRTVLILLLPWVAALLLLHTLWCGGGGAATDLLHAVRNAWMGTDD